MAATPLPPRTDRGQVLIVFVLSLTAIVLVVGLVVDGGNALVQRRGSQNAADFAALAGARIVAEEIGGDTTKPRDLVASPCFARRQVARLGLLGKVARDLWSTPPR